MFLVFFMLRSSKNRRLNNLLFLTFILYYGYPVIRVVLLKVGFRHYYFHTILKIFLVILKWVNPLKSNSYVDEDVK